MIDVALAEKFVKKAGNYTQYNINIMNEKGIIIASSDPVRVGSFHEVAYQIISADKDVVEVVSEDNFQGGRTGINMALIFRKKKIGVLGMTGEPEEIREAARLLKLSLETMLEYEEQNKKHYQQQNLSTRFVDGLLYQEEADSEGELTAVSRQLGYDPALLRIPVLITLERPEDAYLLLEQARKNKILGTQDISAVTRNNNILIYLSFRGQQFNEYKYFVNTWLDKISGLFAQSDIACKYYVGSFQEKYCFYRQGFQHCRWLKKQCGDLTENVYFFYDHIGEYMRSIAPVYEINRIYETVCNQFVHEKKASIVELIETLSRNNYNLNDSSKELFVHKNTLIFRYNKIKDLFDVNPIQSTADREFLDWLVQYLKVNR